MSAISRRAFGATELKITLAAVFLVGAVSVAAYRLMGAKRPAASPRSQQPAGQAVSDEGEAVETNYTRVRSPDDVGVVMASYADDVERAARSLDLGGDVGGAARVASSARDAIEPMLLGDYDAFVAAVERLGGTIDPEQRSRLFDQLAQWMKLGEPDLDRITVRPFEGMGGGGRGEAQPRRVSRTMDEDEGEGPGVAERTMAMRAAGNYPDADPMASEGPTPIEVRVPIRPKSGPNKGGEVTVGVVLIWNAETATWQPGMYSMTTMSLVDGEGP